MKSIHILTLGCFLLAPLLSFSIDNYYTEFLEGDSIHIGDSIQLSDPQYSLHLNDSAYYKNIYSQVFLEIDEESGIMLDSTWEASIEVLLDYQDTAGQLFQNIPVTLNVNHKTGLNQSYDRKDIFNIPGAWRITSHIQSISDSTLLPYLRLGVNVVAERYYIFEASSQVNNLKHKQLTTQGELEISWSPVFEAENYDVEWFWIDNYTAKGKNLSTSQIKTTFNNNASRVNINQTKYEIPILYDRGYIVYRVRPKGIGGADLNSVINGKWRGAISTNFILATYPYKFKIEFGHEVAINWNRSTSYSEDGMRRDAIEYYDGLLNKRQSTAYSNQNNIALVSNSYIDYQGRPVITTLPASAGIQIEFYPNFNRDLNGSLFTSYDFDRDTAYTGLSSSPLSSTKGSARYYSGNNSNQKAQQGYIPNANGYPYSHIQYTPDNTGRIAKAGGVGISHQLGSGHETQYYYSKPLQPEIDRLFGNEIGYSNHYKKNITVDPNGVTSVAYMDASGRTVATALTGNTPDNLLPIDMYTDTINAGLLDNNSIYNGEELRSYQPFLVTDSGLYSFEYVLIPPHYYDTCGDHTICYDFAYTLYLSVVNNKGVEMIPGGSISYSFGDTAFLDTVCTTTDTSIVFSIALSAGQYTVSKSLKLNPATIEAYAESLAELCSPDNFMPPIDTSGCNLTCDECLAALGNKDTFLSNGGTLEDWESMNQICDALCNTLSTCAGFYEIMLMDVSPGGNYGGVWDSLENVVPETYPYSIYNTSNILNYTYANWQHPASPYLDETGKNDTIFLPLPLGDTLLPEQLPSLDLFLDYWKPSWARSLVPYHPEYCFYIWCLSQEGTELFLYEMLSIDSYQDALTNGYLNPLGIIDTAIVPYHLVNPTVADPLFTTSPGYNYLDTMKQWMANYQDIGATIWDVVALATGCSVCDIPCDTLPFGDTTLLNQATLDQQWKMFMSLYLSLRANIQQMIQSNWQVENNCFNNCFDETWVNSILNPGTQLISASVYNPALTIGAYDSLVVTDTACYYINDTIPSVSIGTTVVVIVDNNNPTDTNIFSTIATLPADTCACRTILELYDSFTNKNDLVLFKEHFNTTYNTNLTLQQVIDLMEVCTNQYSSPGSSVYADWCVFENYYEFTSDSALNCDSVQDLFNAQCDTTCNGYALYWRNKLKSCIGDSVLLDSVIQRMIAVCKSGCDPTHPLGSSNAPPGATTSAGDSSFVQIISNLSNCNPYLFGMPRHYSHTLSNETSGFIDDCTCNLIIGKMTMYSSADPDVYDYIGFVSHLDSIYDLNLSLSEIKSLLCICIGSVDTAQLCDPEMALTILVPNEMRCSPCIECNDVEAELQAFISAYPDSSISYENASLIQNYLNYQLGITMSFMGYMSYMDTTLTNCIDDTATICTVPLPPILPPDSSCYEIALAIAEQAGQILYQNYLDSSAKAIQLLMESFALGAVSETFTMEYVLKEGYYTLYYYDRAGNLQRTVPPEGVSPLRTDSLLKAVAEHRKDSGNNPPVYPNHSMSSKYLFNSLNAQIKVETPDADSSRLWYDKLGRVIVSQRARQINENEYGYTIYDALGRIIESGELLYEQPMSQTIAANTTDYQNWVANALKKSYTRTYYDTIAIAIPGFDQENLRNRISTVEMNDERNFAKFRTHKSILQESSMIPPRHRFKRIDYEYDLISGNVKRVIYQGGYEDQFMHSYLYDDDNRIQKVLTSTDGFEWEQDASYTYYTHGPLARKQLGDLDVQGEDYAYTVHGWLKAINEATGKPEDDMGLDGDMTLPGNPNEFVARDAFGYVLGYYGSGTLTNDYDPINGYGDFLTETSGSNLDTTAKDLFNGNIRLAINVTTGYNIQSNAYRYDALNRLKSSRMFDNFDSTAGKWQNNTMLTDNYYSDYTYDLNGNILNLKRNGIADSSLPMDELTYHYFAGTNRLRYLTDSVAASNYPNDLDNQYPNNYTYDRSGNLTDDKSEKLKIEWNYSGKVERVTSPVIRGISFYYDAMGNRVMKELEGDSAYWYVYGADNNLMALYSIPTASLRKPPLLAYGVVQSTTPTHEVEYISSGTEHWTDDLTYADDTSTMRLLEQPIYGSDRIGIYRPYSVINGDSLPRDTAYYNYQRGNKRYELKNHLGNVHVVLSDKRTGVDTDNDTIANYYEAVVMGKYDYYPFGMLQPGRNFNPSSYRFLFNSKEQDPEIKGVGNSYDYGMRMYDPRIGRPLSLDPIARQFPELSPYQFFSNNPIWFIDLDGLEGIPAALKPDEGFTTAISSSFIQNATISSNEISKSAAIFNPYSPGGQIKPYDPGVFGSIEDYLESPSESIGEGVLKVGGNILYGTINEPVKLVFERTLGGRGIDPKEKTEAFIGTATSFLPTKGLGQFKKLDIAEFGTLTKGTFKGTRHAIERGKALKQFNIEGIGASKEIKQVEKTFSTIETGITITRETEEELEK